MMTTYKTAETLTAACNELVETLSTGDFSRRRRRVAYRKRVESLTNQCRTRWIIPGEEDHFSTMIAKIRDAWSDATARPKSVTA